MHPYTRGNNKGRTVGGDDIHHKTADQLRPDAKKAAKAARHGARQHARGDVRAELTQAGVADAE